MRQVILIASATSMTSRHPTAASMLNTVEPNTWDNKVMFEILALACFVFVFSSLAVSYLPQLSSLLFSTQISTEPTLLFIGDREYLHVSFLHYSVN
jgi:hypothetical protein